VGARRPTQHPRRTERATESTVSFRGWPTAPPDPPHGSPGFARLLARPHCTARSRPTAPSARRGHLAPTYRLVPWTSERGVVSRETAFGCRRRRWSSSPDAASLRRHRPSDSCRPRRDRGRRHREVGSTTSTNVRAIWRATGREPSPLGLPPAARACRWVHALGLPPERSRHRIGRRAMRRPPSRLVPTPHASGSTDSRSHAARQASPVSTSSLRGLPSRATRTC
jgi:hypothetical protein